jgi:predicted ferric reductase
VDSIASGIRWVSAYLAAVLAPLVVLLIVPMPPGSGFWWDFSMATGFAAVAMLGIQFVLTARFKRVAAPFGVDIVYYFHRYMAVFAFGLLCAHYLVIRIGNPDALGAAHPLVAPGHMTAGRAAFLCFALVIATSLWRKQLRIAYEPWRVGHAVLSTGGLALAVIHIEGVEYYSEAVAHRLFWSVFLVFWLLVVVYVRVLKPWRMRGRPYRVVDVRQETTRASTVVMEPQGHEGIRFAPGQFAWLTLRASPFAFSEHPFSIASSAEAPQRLEFTIKALGDFTETVRAIAPGEIAYLDGPYGAFSVDRMRAPGFVFIAGGVGIAPIMSMLRTFAQRGDERPLTLVYANRREQGIIFRDELEALRSRLALQVVHVLQEPPAAWDGERGLIDAALLERNLPAEHARLEYLVCGPKPMIQAVEKALYGLQVPLGRVHSELFDLV